MRRVGWTDQPAFATDAFAAIYAWTGGIPRRINLLCNRLLLTAFLTDAALIDAELVRVTGSDLARETGGARAVAEVAEREAAAVPASAGGARPRDAERVEPRAEGRSAARIAAAGHDPSRPPIVLLVDSPAGAFKAALLAQAAAGQPDLPPCVLVSPGDPEAIDPSALTPRLSDAFSLQVHLRADHESAGRRVATLAGRLDELFDELRPVAVISAGISDDVLVGSLLAHQRAIPLARLGAGQRRDVQSRVGDTNAIVIDRLADVLYTPTLKTHYTLYKEGIGADRMVCVGNPLASGLQQMVSTMAPVSELLKVAGLSRDQLRRALRGYALVSAQVSGGELIAKDLPRVARVARDLGRETLVIWLATPATAQAIRSSKADALLHKSGVVVVPASGYAMHLGLLRGATCTIAGPDWEFVEEADVLDIPSIILHPDGAVPPGSLGGVIARIACDSAACVRALHEILERGRSDDEQGGAREGSPTERIVDHLLRWLPVSKPKQRSDLTDAVA
jgi:UDP-N-acetylglucosamine 2-epimerase